MRVLGLNENGRPLARPTVTEPADLASEQSCKPVQEHQLFPFKEGNS